MVFLCCSAGELVKTFELSSEEIVLHRTMGSLNSEVTCARFNHNGKILASCSVDGGICLDVASSGELLSRFFAPAKSMSERRINSVFFSSGSRFLASGGHDGCVRVWDLKTQEVTQTYNISASAVTGVISVCDVRTSDTAGFLAVDPKHGVYKVTAIQSSPHPYARHSLGSTYGDGSVRVWDLTTGQLTSEFVRHHDAAATALAISPVSKVLLATSGLDGRVIFFDTVQGKELRSIDFDQPISALALCADGKTLAVGTTTGEILIYDLRGVITPLYSTRGHDSAAINSLQFATSSTESSVASVFPQGVPVVSGGEQNSPTGRNGAETLQEIAVRKLESLGMGNTYSTGPPSPTSAVRQPQPSSPTRQPTSPQTMSSSPQAQNSYPVQYPTHSEGSAMSSSSPFQQPTRPASPEPSLVSRLSPSVSAAALPRSPEPASAPAPVQAPVPVQTAAPVTTEAPVFIVQSVEKQEMRERIQFVRHELEVQHRTTFDQVSSVLEELLYSYEALVDDNAKLRLENEQLKSHIMDSER
ncbi:hypothetical protein Gpo141_00007795 [Globisporangium polare]